MANRIVTGLLLATMGVACKQALVDSGFRDEALYSTPLVIESFQSFDVETFGHPRIAVFVMPDGLTGDFCEVVQLPDTSQPFAIGTTELNLFRAPDDQHLVQGEGGGRYALLRPMVFEDPDEDGMKDDDERFLGDATDGLMYLPEAVTVETGPTGVALEAGFHPTWWNGPCGPRPVGTDDGDCGVDLGATCGSDGDCGGDGSCLGAEVDPSWPGGYCVVQATKHGCSPKDGRLHLTGKPGMDERKVWLASCTGDDDCRQGEGYFCQPTLGACMRKTSLRVQLGRASKRASCKGVSLEDMPSASDDIKPDAGPQNDDAGMAMAGGDAMSAGPNDCTPPDPRCDGMPGGGKPMDTGPDDDIGELDRICGNSD